MKLEYGRRDVVVISRQIFKPAEETWLPGTSLPCFISVAFTAVNNVRSWALDREVFQNIMRRTAETRHEQYRNFLRRSAPKCTQQAGITRIETLLLLSIGQCCH